MNILAATATTKTPIEIALQANEEGMVSARNLYDFLEYQPSNFARWCQDNIVNNPALEENVDFIGFLHYEENPLGGRPSTDYLITADVAKEICMAAKSERGKEARKYFLQTEKELVNAAIQLMSTAKELKENYQQLRTLVESTNEQFNNRLACIESGTSVSGGKLSKWVKTTSDEIMDLAKYCNCSVKEMYTRAIERMEYINGIFFQRFFDEYAACHPNEKPIWRIVVIEYYDLKDAFEEAYIQIGREVGFYRRPNYDDFEF